MSKLLCVDALNFSREFLGGTVSKHKAQWPKLNKIFQQVDRFVKATANLGFKIVIFIDGTAVTSETFQKWKTRREREVRNKERNIIQGFSTLVGEYFQRCNVEVHYSSEADNDDTLVSYAFAHHGDILSEDNDMFRYTHNGNPLNLTVYSDFQYDRNGVIFLTPHPRQPGTLPLDRTSREVIVPPPKTLERNLDFQELLKKEIPQLCRGSPSPLTRDLGNIHLTFTELRQAGYYKANINIDMPELFPDWDDETNNVVWVQQTVKPDSKYLDLLEDPKKALQVFPDRKQLTQPVPPFMLKHHEMARKIVACEIISSATLTPLVSLIEKHFPELLANDKDETHTYSRPNPSSYQQKKYNPSYRGQESYTQHHRYTRPTPPFEPVHQPQPPPSVVPTTPSNVGVEPPEITGWKIHMSELYKQYYYFNPVTNQTVWYQPDALPPPYIVPPTNPSYHRPNPSSSYQRKEYNPSYRSQENYTQHQSDSRGFAPRQTYQKYYNPRPSTDFNDFKDQNAVRRNYQTASNYAPDQTFPRSFAAPQTYPPGYYKPPSSDYRDLSAPRTHQPHQQGYYKPSFQSFPKPAADPYSTETPQYSHDTVFVSNLPLDADENALVELFKDFQVSRVSLPINRETGARRGFAFVKFANTDDCTHILEKESIFQIGENEIAVQRSRKQTPRQ